MNGKTLLLVEDNKKVQNFNVELLTKQGFAVETAMSLAEAGACLSRQMPDAIVLDIGMPDGNGLDFLRELRQTSKIPVLMLTGYGENKDVVKGFNSGCDDYLPKPYTFEVLLVRLERLLRSAEQVPETVTKGALKLNVSSLVAYVNDVDILLTQKEFALLMLTLQREGRHLSAEYLYEKVWGQPMVGDTGAVRRQISLLRKKLEGSGYTISVTRGEGYCFERE